NAMFRPDSVLRTLGPEWEGKPPFEIGSELFRRFLAHPEGVEMARQRLEANLEDHLGFPDGKIRLAPEAMLPEIRRAIATEPATSGCRTASAWSRPTARCRARTRTSSPM